ncbi:polysaccharide biosynthesis/export family protein [Methylobacterium sp. J-077]|uniref:polysaccharide biosynthesis/export family protein n=1 Tax=Methylobacterium sp. J-077 TaxID=2836656 RepID=UPI001FB914DF|nr:polysaccharide biosynthesis/export family protein [Methylobacterium sp. J-077]MCJ2121187.1 polysaccharide biosynthesis/export family protein [Methylobacterium sp. J-077]
MPDSFKLKKLAAIAILGKIFGGSWTRMSLSVLMVSPLVGAPISSARAADPIYHLGPQDKLKLRVSEWRSAPGQVVEWSALTGEYSIDASGILSLPLIGQVDGLNKTTSELASIISERLRQSAGLIQPPAVSLEVSQYRPFYILGQVDKPGEYSFRPGLLILQAISIAGGYRRADRDQARTSRDLITTRGDLAATMTQQAGLLAARDRLAAESQDRERIDFSAQLQSRQSEPIVAQAMREQVLIFNSRRQTLNSQIDMISKAKSFLEDEAKTLISKTDTQKKQVDLLRKDLAETGNMVSRGLVTTPRLLSAELNVVQYENALLDISVAASRNKQEIARSERSMVDMKNIRRDEILKDLREITTKLAETDGKIKTLRLSLLELEADEPGAITRDSQSKVVLRIIRRTGGQTREMVVGDTEAVEPGDIVQVQLPETVRPFPQEVDVSNR